MADLKAELHRKLHEAREGLMSKLDGLSEYDLRRPLTPTGTNLLGLAKHLAGGEYVYLGTSFGRTPPETLAWEEDGSVWEGADMWATPSESSEYILGLYRRACAHGDLTIEELGLDTAGRVPHWPAERADTTLGVLLIRMLAETARHAGHADIVRELIDGKAGADHDELGDAATWSTYLARVRAAADAFAPPP
ncbi:DinB family protein [Jiangella endophytica]|uniref:DinB family protein n=1 Tax=Jiangella endophytica TaxID=1623398 RepID=UPI000E3440BD|nr:DinB family protein [Jiangella endophytica]